jgi:hypothetical protein
MLSTEAEARELAEGWVGPMSAVSVIVEAPS